MVLNNFVIKKMCIDCKRKRKRDCAMGLYCDNSHVFRYWFLLVNSYSTLLILELIYCVICCWSFISLSVQCPCAVTCLLLKFFIKL